MSSVFSNALAIDAWGWVGIAIAALAGIAFVVLSRRRIEWLLVMVVSGAAFVGSSSDVVDVVASGIRWVGIGILFLLAIANRPLAALNPSVAFFAGYAVLGFVFLLNAVEPLWQVQRSLLLLGTVLAVPWATASIVLDSRSAKRLFLKFGAIGIIVGVAAAIQIPSQLGAAARFGGISKGVPHFAVVLGSLLPFIWFAVLEQRSVASATSFFVLFSISALSLAMSAQRAGSIAGVIGIIAVTLGFGVSQFKMPAAFLVVLIITVASLLGEHSSAKVEYLQRRYSPDAGVSDRERIWSTAYEKVLQNPLIGYGIGSAEKTRGFSTSFHSAYLEVWYNTGLVGGLLFVISFGRAAYVMIDLLRYSGEHVKAQAALCIGVVLSMSFVSLFESIAAGASTISVVLFLVVATAMESLRRRATSRPMRATPRIRTMRSGPYGK